MTTTDFAHQVQHIVGILPGKKVYIQFNSGRVLEGTLIDVKMDSRGWPWAIRVRTPNSPVKVIPIANIDWFAESAT